MQQLLGSCCPLGVGELLRGNLKHLPALTCLALDCCPASAVHTIAMCGTLQELRVGRLVFEVEAMLYSALLSGGTSQSGSRVDAVLAPLARLARLRHLHVSAYRTRDDCILMGSCGPFPTFLSTLASLETLTLPNVSGAPQGPGSLPWTNLQSLTLPDAALRHFPVEALAPCTALQHLAMDFAVQYDWVGPRAPQGITSLAASLQCLELGHVPDPGSHVSSLTGLTRLALTSCGLGAVPEWLPALKALQELSFRDNDISVWPPDLGQLTSLRYLDIAYNGHRVWLPTALLELPHLHTLEWGPGLVAEELEAMLLTRSGVQLRVDAALGAWRLADDPMLRTLPLSVLGEAGRAAQLLSRVAVERVLSACDAAMPAVVMVLN